MEPLKEPLTINHAVGFALIAGGAYFVFEGPLERDQRGMSAIGPSQTSGHGANESAFRGEADAANVS